MAKELPQDKVKKYLLELIKDLPANARLPTEMSLAKELAVCRQTVHKVMRTLVADGLIVRRKKGGTFVAGSKGTFVVEGDRGLQIKKNIKGTLLVVYPNWLSEDIRIKVDFAEQEARRLDYDIKYLKVEPTSDSKIITKVVKNDGSIKAVFYISPDCNTGKADLEELDKLGVPLVIAGAVEEVSSLKNIYIIVHDCVSIATHAMKLLIDNGHKKIGYIANEPWDSSSEQLKKSMQDYLRGINMPIRNLVLTEKNKSAWSLSGKVAYKMANKIFDKDVSAVVVDSYQGAIGVRRAAYEKGIRIPEDLSIVLLNQPLMNSYFDCPRFHAVFADRSHTLNMAMRILLTDDPKPKKQIILVESEIYIGESVKNLIPCCS